MLKEFGNRLRMARLRRKWPKSTVAARVGVSRTTLDKVEDGCPAVQLGVYLRTLVVLQLQEDFNLLAANDPLGRRLQDLGIDTPRRAPRRKKQVLAQDPENGDSHE